MVFNVSVTNSSDILESFAVSGSSWSNCLSYLEGTGNTIKSINLVSIDVFPNVPNQGYSYTVNLKSISDNTTLSVEFYDTYSNVISWINSQVGYTLQNMVRLNKNFISI